jgi:sugar O-acyltransferase (sialic acid O-acetyltransferase NeuD family)
MQEIIIIGGKGTAINIAEQIEDARVRFNYPMKVVGFAIDDPALGDSIAGIPIVCGLNEIRKLYLESKTQFIFALYKPNAMASRIELLNSLELPVSKFANFIHPLSYIGSSVKLGNGNVILSHSNLMHGAQLGSFNIINSGVTIEHDTIIGSNVFLAAKSVIGSHVNIGNGVFVGLNSCIRETVNLGDLSFVGMGSTVLKNVRTGATVYGSPVK